MIPGRDAGALARLQERYRGPLRRRIGAEYTPTSAIGHGILGSAEPYESWNATYTEQ